MRREKKQEQLCRASLSALTMVAEDAEDQGADLGTIVASFSIALGRLLAAHYDEDQTTRVLETIEEYVDDIRAG